MAITVAFYGLTMEKIAEQVGNDVNYLTGTVKLSLHTSSYVPDRDVDNFFDDATNELGSGNGYTTGGETLGGKTITYDTASDQVRWDANDVPWTFTASKTWQFGVMYVDTAGAASTDPLYALLSWDTSQTVSTPYTLQWDSAGILYIDTTRAMEELERNIDAGWSIRGISPPRHIAENLERAGAEPAWRQPRGGGQSWEEVLYATISDGTAVTAAAETILVPDSTFPANYLYPGRVLRYTLWGKVSTVITTPGTITQRLRWGGVAGTSLAASGAYAPDSTAAATDLTFYTEYTVVCRATGTSAASLTFGRSWLSDYDDASAATVVANLNMHTIPASAPAAVDINTTTANALSPTWTQSAATGSVTCMLAILESLT